mgnify:CR=1 FL=1
MAKERKRPKDEPLAPPTRGSERKAFLLRLSPELHAELREWAARDMRSLNAQIEYLLREAVNKRGGRRE